MTSTLLYELPAPSTALLESPVFQMLPGRSCALTCAYEGAEYPEIIQLQLIFTGIEAFTCTYLTSLTVEMLEAYDRVITVAGSQWLTEIRKLASARDVERSKLKHMRICFDGGPCYDFICTDMTTTQAVA